MGTRYATTLFTLVLVTDDSIDLLSSEPTDGSRWAYTVTKSGKKTIIAGRIKTSVKLTKDPVGEQSLVKLAFGISKTAKEGIFGKITLHVEDLAQYVTGPVDLRGKARKRGEAAPPASYYDRKGIHRGNDDGATIPIIAETTAGYLVCTRANDHLNTAVLNGKLITSAITAKKCTSCPRNMKANVDMCLATCAAIVPTCSTNDGAVVTLDKCAVGLVGKETKGSAAAKVSVKADSKEIGVSAYRVWFPKALSNGNLLTVSFSRTTLAPINGWKSGDSCALGYQAADIIVTATFIADASVAALTMIVTNMVREFLASSDTAKVSILTKNEFIPRARGLAAGKASVVVTRDKKVLGTAELTLLDAKQAMDVRSIDILLANKLSLHNPGATDNCAAQSKHVANASTALVLDTEGSAVAVFVNAVFQDGSTAEVAPTDGIKLTIIKQDGNVIELKDSASFLVGDQSGTAQLGATWADGFCKGTVATGSRQVTVKLAAPVKIELKLAKSLIVASSDASSRIAGLATSTTVHVFVTYKNGHRKDVSTDSRLSFSEKELGGLVRLTRSKEGVFTLVPNTDGKVGVAKLHATFKGLDANLVANLNGQGQALTVAKLAKLAITTQPFPKFAGSEKLLKSKLLVYQNTNIWQKATLHTTAVLTDGTKIVVDSHTSTSYKLFADGTNTVEDSIVTVKRISQADSSQVAASD